MKNFEGEVCVYGAFKFCYGNVGSYLLFWGIIFIGAVNKVLGREWYVFVGQFVL